MVAKQHRLWVAVFMLGVLITACTLPSKSEDANRQTQVALGVQATQIAKQGSNGSDSNQNDLLATQNAQATTLAEQATQLAAGSGPGAADLTATESALLTQVAQAAAATVAAQVPTQTETQPATVAPPPTEAPPAPTDTPIPQQSFQDWVQGANILLFEDMAGNFSTTRYVKAALDGLGYRYVDVKDALGLFKEQLLSGGPGGNGWDLIISAKEARGGVSGEFYVMLNDQINAGSAVIIEEWDLDAIGLGKVSTILNRCGVEFQSDWWMKPINEQLLWPVDGSSPVLHKPNDGISLRNPTGFWPNELGDFLRLAPGSSAIPLWSARTSARDSYLTAVSCVDGRVIIQTHATHNYGRDRSVMMWQNYIYNTLKARFDSLPK